MLFLSRAVRGLFLLILTLSLVAIAGWRLTSSLTQKPKSNDKSLKERSFVVEAQTLVPTTIRPVLVAYGQIRAWTTLDLRAATSGPITDLSRNFRDGRLVKKGEVLFTIDPEVAARRVVDAKAALAQAQSVLAEAKASVALLRSELSSARAQLKIRKRDLKRKRQLMSKRVTTETILDQATIAVSSGEQAVIAKEQGLTAGVARVEQGKASVERATLTLRNAQKALKDSTLRAPFDGRLTDVNATLGRRVAQNEKLGALIDLTSLEVAFPVRNRAYARLADPADASRIAQLPVKVKLKLGDDFAVIEGRLDRSSAVVSANQAGRTVFAKLIDANRTPLRPGDFVTVEVRERELRDVTIIPASAATVDGRILVIGPDSRLREVKAKIIRYQGDDLIVSGVPFGQRIVRVRLPFLASGVLVKVKPSEPKLQSKSGGLIDRKGLVTLGEAERNRLKTLVRNNVEMRPERKKALLEMLSQKRAPRAEIEGLRRLAPDRG